MKEHLRFKSMSLLCAGVALSLSLGAQNQPDRKTTERPYAQEVESLQKTPSHNSNKGKTSAVIWSQDFANGIPAGWVNQGYSDANGTVLPNCLWEYRGPATTPSISTGSRGQYAAANDPILSPTRTNGFIIFDSNYLDDGGIAGNDGNGPAPAPHLGTLTTGTIDLTGHPNVELAFSSYLRQYQSKFQVAISTNGGITFPDTVNFHTSVPQNSSSPNGSMVSANISTIAGNQANVKLQIVFDGLEINSLGLAGYYYWMIDDMVIRDLPANSFRFVESGGAPANDIIFGASGGSKTGIMALDHVVPVTFDSNILNYGYVDQTDVVLHVDVYNDATGAIEASLTSPTKALMASGTVADFNDFTTTQAWTPTATGMYHMVYYVTSDSVSANDAGSGLDTMYTTFVTDSIHSLDYNNFSNSLGTNALGSDGSALASSLYFPNGGNGGAAFTMYGIDLRLSSLTVPGGDIEVHVYDTTGFDYLAGFGSSALYTESYTITPGMEGTLARFNFTTPQTMNAGTYYVVVYMFSNLGNNTIRIANDQAVSQPGASSIMYNADDARWYSGYLNSRTFSSPWIRARVGKVIGLNEYATNSFSVYPNPTQGRNVNVAIEQGGTYTVDLVTLTGKTVMSKEITVSGNEAYELNIPSHIAAGTYMVNIKSDKEVKVSKLTIN
ncbi:MAG: T9SS type A sorting domain-containing protein [Owenweeksia sp.]